MDEQTKKAERQRVGQKDNKTYEKMDKQIDAWQADIWKNGQANRRTDRWPASQTSK